MRSTHRPVTTDETRVQVQSGSYVLQELRIEAAASPLFCGTTPATFAEVASSKSERLAEPQTSPVPGGVEGRTGEVAERRTSVPPSQAKIAGERSEHRAIGTNEEWSEAEMISVGLLASRSETEGFASVRASEKQSGNTKHAGSDLHGGRR